jgi:ThiF family
MTTFAETLDRTQKLLVDAGVAKSFDEAQSRRQLDVLVVAGVAHRCSTQAAILTCVATARRAFNGRVSVLLADPKSPAVGSGFQGKTLGDAAAQLGADTQPTDPNVVISVDGAEIPIVFQTVGTQLWITSDGWIAKVDSRPLPTTEYRSSNPLVGIVAGSTAISEAFQKLLLGHPVAGNRAVERTLWRPDVACSNPEAQGPQEFCLPNSAWLIGLGHLGQGYLWALALSPVGTLEVAVQDTDRVVAANISTGLLVGEADVDARKTRVVDRYLESMGANCSIIERRLSAADQWTTTDPSVVLFGVDSFDARRAISGLKAPLAIDAALGSRPHNFDAITIRVFPDIGPSHEVAEWNQPSTSELTIQSAYHDIGLDPCGIVTVAGKAAGASFVGAFAGAMVWAELARRSMGGPTYSRLDFQLRTGELVESSPQSSGAARWPHEIHTVS